MGTANRLRELGLVGIVFAGAVGLFFWETLFTERWVSPNAAILVHPPWNVRPSTAFATSNPLLSDHFLLFYPGAEYTARTLTRGIVPLWNPHILCGVPHVAAIETAPLFPLYWLCCVFGTLEGFAIAAMLKALVAGVSCYVFLRVLGCAFFGAALGGLAFMFNGFMVVWLLYPLTNVVMWLPTLFVLLHQLARRPRAAHAVGLGFTVCLMLLGGHPPTAVHCFAAGLLYFACLLIGALVRGRRVADVLRSCLMALVGCLVGVALAAPQLLPFAEYYDLSSLAVSDVLVRRGSTALPLHALAGLVVPDFFGRPPHTEWAGLLGMVNYNERCMYVGVLPLIFAAACVGRLRRDRDAAPFVLLAAGALAAAFGFPPILWLIDRAPLLSQLNNSRLLCVFCFSASVLAGLGADHVSRDRGRSHALSAFVAFSLLAAGLIVVTWFACLCRIPDVQEARAGINPTVPLVTFGLLCLGSGAVLFRRARHKLSARRLCAAGLLVVTLDMFLFGSAYNGTVSARENFPVTPSVRFLAEHEGRFLALGRAFRPNAAMCFGLHDVRGWDSIGFRSYERLVTGKAGDFFFYRHTHTIPEISRKLNARYIVSPQALKPDIVRGRGLKPAFDGEVTIYEDPSCLPRAHVADGTPAAVQVTDVSPNEARVDTPGHNAGSLTLLDGAYPGWRAYVNGRFGTIRKAHGHFRKVSLPAQGGSVVFAYCPRSFLLGTGLSLAGLFGAVVCGAAGHVLRRRTA